MKIYISADIEGITGVSTWLEAADMASFEAREQMTKEVAAACVGAFEAGATEVIVKDAHGEGKNLIHSMLPKQVKILSGWRNHPFNMVEGLDDSFVGVLFIGYHSDALANTSPLAHTLSPTSIRGIWINEEPVSEFNIYTYAANSIGVPAMMVSGDAGLIQKVKAFDANIQTVVTQEGVGAGIMSQHPEVSCEQIKQAAKQAVQNLGRYQIKKPENFTVKVAFTKHQDAYKYSFYPGAKQVGEFEVEYTSHQYMDILTFLLFM